MVWTFQGTSSIAGRTQSTKDNPKGNVVYNQWRNTQTNENIILPKGQNPNEGQFQGSERRRFSNDGMPKTQSKETRTTPAQENPVQKLAQDLGISRGEANRLLASSRGLGAAGQRIRQNVNGREVILERTSEGVTFEAEPKEGPRRGNRLVFEGSDEDVRQSRYFDALRDLGIGGSKSPAYVQGEDQGRLDAFQIEVRRPGERAAAQTFISGRQTGKSASQVRVEDYNRKREEQARFGEAVRRDTEKLKMSRQNPESLPLTFYPTYAPTAAALRKLNIPVSQFSSTRPTEGLVDGILRFNKQLKPVAQKYLPSEQQLYREGQFDYLPQGGRQIASFVYKAGTGPIESVRQNPLLLPSLYAGSRFAGAGFSAVRYPLGKLGKYTQGIPGISTGISKISQALRRGYRALPLPTSIKYQTPRVVVAGAFVLPSAVSVYKAEGQRPQQLGREVAYLGTIGQGVRAGTIDTGRIISALRSRGTTTIPTSEVIAPEFIAGQKFPSIRQGQTAGSLLKEFRVNQNFFINLQRRLGGATDFPRLYGGAGFTASPSTFDKRFIVDVGSSELEGLYSAPRLSPSFLKLATKETSLFEFALPKAAEPTVLFGSADIAKLAPGVGYSQRYLADLRRMQKEFANLPKGQLTVPFVKTEKEAVIPAGTVGVVKQRRYSVNYEGYKIPILEAQFVSEQKVTSQQISKVLSKLQRELQKVSSSRVTSSPVGVLSPQTSISRALGLSRSSSVSPSRASSTGSSSSKSLSLSVSRGVSSNVSRISRRLSSSASSRRRSSRGSLSYSYSGLSRRSSISRGSSRRSSTTGDFPKPPTSKINYSSIFKKLPAQYKAPKVSSNQKNTLPKYTPSVEAIFRNIRSASQPKQVKGLSLRPIVSSRRRRRR